MGKDFSMKPKNVKRNIADFYQTPYSMTDQIIAAEKLERGSPYEILEPASGDGAVSRRLKANGIEVYEYDLETDFLKETDRYPIVMTNPPYSLASEFIIKAKQVATQRIIFLLPLVYLHGLARFNGVWRDTEFPLARVHVFVRRPMLSDSVRPDGKYATGMQDYAWFIWDKTHSGPPQIRWIDNREFVLKKVDQKIGRCELV